MQTRDIKYYFKLFLLIFLALILLARLLYVYGADNTRFPINTVKINATYNHVSQKKLKEVLNNYLDFSFFALPSKELKADILTIAWVEDVKIRKIWPDLLKITIIEKKPVAYWNQQLVTSEGKLFPVDAGGDNYVLPILSGPENQQKDVLQIYQKLSKLLGKCGLKAVGVELSENQSWELVVAPDIKIRLGKKDLDKRIRRFCKAYVAVFENREANLKAVDLRYAHGMAVQWK